VPPSLQVSGIFTLGVGPHTGERAAIKTSPRAMRKDVGQVKRQLWQTFGQNAATCGVLELSMDEMKPGVSAESKLSKSETADIELAAWHMHF